MTARQWSRYALAMERFQADPSPHNEGAVIGAYSEFVRSFCPDDADELISLFCRHLSRWLEQRKAA